MFQHSWSYINYLLTHYLIISINLPLGEWVSIENSYSYSQNSNIWFNEIKYKSLYIIVTLKKVSYCKGDFTN